MISSVIKGGVFGGLILFVWGFISWVILPWHNVTLHKFKDEAAVEAVLKANATHSGVYILPNPHQPTPGMTSEQMKAEEQAGTEKMMKGPLVFASIRLGSGPAMTQPMMIGLLTQIVAALLVSWLVLKAGELGYLRRVVFVTIFAVAAGVVTHLPYWNWWDFSKDYTVVAMADLVIGWFLAGLVIAMVAKRQTY